MPAPATITDRLIGLAPVLTLVIVAVNQITKANTGNLSPWKGGGFGMFSTMDSPGNRYLHCTGITSDGTHVVLRGLFESRPSVNLRSHDYNLITTYPTTSKLQMIAEATLAGQYVAIDTNELALRARLLSNSPDASNVLEDLPQRPILTLVPLDSESLGHDGAIVHTLDIVEISVWNNTFDASTHVIQAEMMLPPVKVLRNHVEVR